MLESAADAPGPGGRAVRPPPYRDLALQPAYGEAEAWLEDYARALARRHGAEAARAFAAALRPLLARPERRVFPFIATRDPDFFALFLDHVSAVGGADLFAAHLPHLPDLLADGTLAVERLERLVLPFPGDFEPPQEG